MKEEEIIEVMSKLQKKAIDYKNRKRLQSAFNDDEYYSYILFEYIRDLKHQRKTLNDQLDRELIKRARLEDRIKKATEYIKTNVKEHQHDDYDITLFYALNQTECEELLEILKGEE